MRFCRNGSLTIRSTGPGNNPTRGFHYSCVHSSEHRDQQVVPPCVYCSFRKTEVAGEKIKSVPSVERVLSILEMLASSQRGLTPSQIARNLQMARSSAHYLLVTLERRGYLHRGGESGRYLFTPK